jgi:hypothetical protein
MSTPLKSLLHEEDTTRHIALRKRIEDFTGVERNLLKQFLILSIRIKKNYILITKSFTKEF